MLQEIAWGLTVVLVGAFAVVFLIVAAKAREPRPAAEVTASGYAVRRVWFWVLAVGGVVVTAATLPLMPYPDAQAKPAPAVVVTATGAQWAWTLSRDKLPLGREVEFQVTSRDVNHGFAIYDPDLKVVAQTQAMPGYVNRIRHTFDRPGTYKVLCLEYCGLVHHDMMAGFTVAAE